MLDLVESVLIKECVQQENYEKSPNMFPLPWYPDKIAWQLELTRKDIRRIEAYYKLHNFLIAETEHGTISGQETVGMISPLVLHVQPDHKILDMCGAPGSIMAQLLELLHKNENIYLTTAVCLKTCLHSVAFVLLCICESLKLIFANISDFSEINVPKINILQNVVLKPAVNTQKSIPQQIKNELSKFLDFQRPSQLFSVQGSTSSPTSMLGSSNNITNVFDNELDMEISEEEVCTQNLLEISKKKRFSRPIFNTKYM